MAWSHGHRSVDGLPGLAPSGAGARTEFVVAGRLSIQLRPNVLHLCPAPHRGGLSHRSQSARRGPLHTRARRCAGSEDGGPCRHWRRRSSAHPRPAPPAPLVCYGQPRQEVGTGLVGRVPRPRRTVSGLAGRHPPHLSPGDGGLALKTHALLSPCTFCAWAHSVRAVAPKARGSYRHRRVSRTTSREYNAAGAAGRLATEADLPHSQCCAVHVLVHYRGYMYMRRSDRENPRGRAASATCSYLAPLPSPPP